MTKRRRFKQSVPFTERLAQWANDMREHAAALPPGEERDGLLTKARQAEVAARLWRCE